MSVKSFCVSCAQRIPDPQQNYVARGNYCAKCNILADINNKKRRAALLEPTMKKKLVVEKKPFMV